MTGGQKGIEFGLRNNLLLNQCFSNIFTFFRPGNVFKFKQFVAVAFLGHSGSVEINVLGVSAYKWLGK